MKILFIIYSLEGGGAERATVSRANYFSEVKKWEVSLMTVDSSAGDFYPVSPEVRRIRLDEPPLKGGLLGPFSVNMERISRIKKEILNLAPDAIVTEMTASNVLGILASAGTGCRVVIEERVHPPMMPLPLIWKALRKMSYPFADRAVALTRKTADWFGKEGGKPGASVIPNPVVYPVAPSGAAIEPAKVLKPGRKTLLAAGRLDRQKGFDLLLEAFSGLAPRHADWDLVILGEGEQMDDLKTIAHGRSISNRVFFPGKAGNMAEWYRSADIFVLSSRFEGFPNVLAEAMSYGVPAVAFDCDTGPADIIRDRVDGLLVPPGNVSLLSAAMSELMSDEETRKLFSPRAAEIRERFSMEKIAGMWERLFSEMLAEK